MRKKSSSDLPSGICIVRLRAYVELARCNLRQGSRVNRHHVEWADLSYKTTCAELDNLFCILRRLLGLKPQMEPAEAFGSNAGTNQKEFRQFHAQALGRNIQVIFCNDTQLGSRKQHRVEKDQKKIAEA
jgi:hypothetical protein